MAYRLTYKDKTFLLVHTGMISIGEINESNGVIHGHEKFDSHKYQIVDLLNADFSEMSLTMARQPGATDSAASKTKTNIKVALLVEEEKAIKFCNEYISIAKKMGSNWSFELFTNMELALKWLKI